ncbi:MAG: pantoate kinase [Methanoregula sp.]|nr:MAG: pantoate kinase [Methanoregula sp.]
MKRSVTAFCPGHISGYFKRVMGQDAATTGSCGAGIVISEGVHARVEPSEHTTILVCRKDQSGERTVISRTSPPVAYAMEQLSLSARVTTECSLPIGAGFGLSAAAILAALTALDNLYDLGMGEDLIARAAHESEIEHRTGLGDVAACRGGGFVVRPTAGIAAPVHRYLNLPGAVYALSFGPIHTPDVLGSKEQMDRVATAFPKDVPLTISDFFSLSKNFAEQSGLITHEVSRVLAGCRKAGVPASMTMLGNGVFAYSAKAKNVLAGFGAIYEMHIAQEGPRVIGGTP